MTALAFNLREMSLCLGCEVMVVSNDLKTFVIILCSTVVVLRQWSFLSG